MRGLLARPGLLSCLGLLNCLALLVGAANAAQEARPPNFVVIFTDDQGWADVGCYGATGFETPHLDRMAAEGVRFTDFYVAAPVCTPSRAALLTGCYPRRVGLAHRVLFPYSTTGLHPDEVTIAELLKERGYATACIGKWHLGHQPELLPGRQGFERFYGVPYSNDMDRHHYRHNDFRAPPLPLYDDEEVVEVSPPDATLTRRYTDAALEFVRANRERPFFLYLAHSMPHQPIDASAPFKGRSAAGLYGDVIEELDASVGRLLAALAELGLDEETLVLFTSDNGPWHRGSAGPLRGGKNTTWEGGMRVPCIARWPGRVPAGRTCSELATAMDLLPTFGRLAGAELPAERTIDGRDVWPLLAGAEGAESPHAAFFYYRDDRLQAVRSGRWKLHVYRPDWKALAPESRRPLLFDLEADPGETTDVAAQHPEVVQRLLALADGARGELGDAVTGARGSGVRPVGGTVDGR